MLPYTLLAAVVDKGIQVELKTGETFNGILVAVDHYMNIRIKQGLLVSKEADKFYEVGECFIKGSTIKFLRISDDVKNEVKAKEAKEQQSRGKIYRENMKRLQKKIENETTTKKESETSTSSDTPAPTKQYERPQRGGRGGSGFRGGRGGGGRGGGRGGYQNQQQDSSQSYQRGGAGGGYQRGGRGGGSQQQQDSSSSQSYYQQQPQRGGAGGGYQRGGRGGSRGGAQRGGYQNYE